jgi:ArsR family transcriptional regulator
VREYEDHCRKSNISVNEKDESYVCGLFKMLGDAGRLKIVCALMGTKMCVAHLAEEVGMEQSALSHQLRNLKNAGLVKAEKSGKQVFYSLDDEHVYTIIKQAVEHAEHIKRSI